METCLQNKPCSTGQVQGRPTDLVGNSPQAACLMLSLPAWFLLLYDKSVLAAIFLMLFRLISLDYSFSWIGADNADASFPQLISSAGYSGNFQQQRA